MPLHSLSRLVRQVAEAPQQPWVLATLVRCLGSSYRRVGARLLIAADGTWQGTLSGGCLEADIAAKSGELLARGGSPELLTYDTRLLYGCDGRVDILIEHLPPHANPILDIAAAFRVRGSRRVAVVHAGPQPWGTRILPLAVPALDDEGVFEEELAPPVRLLLFGRGPELAMLRALAACVGWECEVFAQPDELPAGLHGDARTGAVVLNHHFGRDCATLARLLPLALPYIGLLGPRRRRMALLERLQELGGSEPPTANLYAPAGLDLGGESPDEIAFAIIAEAMAVFGGRSAGFLRDRQLPIHDRQPIQVAT